MKATLEFNLPEESEEHLRAVKALDMALALWNFREELRILRKNSDEGEEDIYERIWDILNDKLDHHDINLESLIS